MLYSTFIIRVENIRPIIIMEFKTFLFMFYLNRENIKFFNFKNE